MMKTYKALLFVAAVCAAPPASGASPALAHHSRAVEASLSPVDPLPVVAEPSSFAPGAIPLPSSVAAAAEAADPAIDALAGDDEPEIEKEIEAESRELEEIRAAEQKKLGEVAAPDHVAVPERGERIALLPELDVSLAELQARYDIPIDVNEMVVEYIRFFQSEPVRKHFVKWLSRSYKYIPRFREILKEQGLPEDTVYLAMIESGFANFAYSSARASGAWQFIASTGKLYGLKQDFWVDERRDPEKAARAAARFLKRLNDDFGDWRLAWASYNAGPGKIRKAQLRGETDFWTMATGRVLKRETKGYVPKLMAAAIISKHPEAFGFEASELDPEKWVEYETVTLSNATALAAIAKASDVTEKEIQDLNPELRRYCTPPRSYALKVPTGTADTFARNWPDVSQSARLAFARHRVSRGETLQRIAAAYGASSSAVLKINGIREGRRVRPGTELVIPLPYAGRRGAAVASAAVRVERPEMAREPVVKPEPVATAAEAQQSEDRSGRMRATVLVRAGDSLWGIAKKFGVEIADLCRWNNIKDPRQAKILVGQRLVVYPKTAAAEPSMGPARGPG